MKSLPIALGLFLASFSLRAQDQQPSLRTLDENYGFRNARFEKDTSVFKDLALAEKAGNTRYYRRKSEIKKLGEGEVADITYGFYKGKLAVIVLKTQGAKNSRAVLAALQQQVGPGVQGSPFAQRYSWNAKLVHMSYEENAMSNDAVILLTCKKIKELELKQNLRSRPAAPVRS